jgi:hypothetical protein
MSPIFGYHLDLAAQAGYVGSQDLEGYRVAGFDLAYPGLGQAGCSGQRASASAMVPSYHVRHRPALSPAAPERGSLLN